MQVLEIVGATVVLLGTIGVGFVAHELAHAAVLSLFGIPYEIEWFPTSGTRGFHSAVSKTWATVTPSSISPEVSPWKLRLSAIAPLVLAVPPSLIRFGVGPLDGTSPLVVPATVGLLGCALPSPQDFSLFWHADRMIEENSTGDPAER
jgi:hypothetical protein